MTAPVTETQVVLGKYLAALAFYVVLWVPTLVYVVIIAMLQRPSTGVRSARPTSASLGIGALFLSVGALRVGALDATRSSRRSSPSPCSSCCSSVGLLENLVNDRRRKKVLSYLNLWQHMDDFSQGDRRHPAPRLLRLGRRCSSSS